MKIAVIGAGVIGICSAYELTRDGHEVTVYDKNTAAAEGSSFANAGLISGGLTLPRSMPPWNGGALSAFSSNQDKIRISRNVTIQQLKWLWTWRKAHRHPHFLNKCRDLHSLMKYSQIRMQETALHTGFELERQSGQLLLCSEDHEMQKVSTHVKWLKELGNDVRQVAPAEVPTIEPALANGIKLAGAWHFASDETVNSRQFALLLKNEAIRMGASFQFNAEVIEVKHGATPSITLKNDPNCKPYDGIVFCTGGSPSALRLTLNQSLPIAELDGYSLSAPIQEALNAPRGSLIDSSTGHVIARIGNRVRVTQGATLGDFSQSGKHKTIQNLYRSLQTHFPSAVRFSTGVQIWKGVEFTSSDGLPFIGPIDATGIWLNLGHGANGWGLACGSARVIADMIGRKTPSVDVVTMHPARHIS